MIHRFTHTIGVDHRLGPGQGQSQFRSDVEISHPMIQQYDPESPDIAFATRIAREVIHIAGADVIVYARTNNADYDKVWEEDPNPTYFAGKRFKAYFKPEAIKLQLTLLGIDAPNQTTITFCKDDLYRDYRERLVRPGDIIEVPYGATVVGRPDRYRIINATETGNFRYHWLYVSCKIETITDDAHLDIAHR